MNSLRIFAAWLLILSHVCFTGAMQQFGGGGRPRQQSYGYVREPAVGFYVGGSKIDELNGLYGRVQGVDSRVKHKFQLAYKHDTSNWYLAMTSANEETGRPSEWLLIDANRVDRFSHEGETILPGSGTRWAHVHQEGGQESERRDVSAEGGGDDDMELPWQIIGIMGEV